MNGIADQCLSFVNSLTLLLEHGNSNAMIMGLIHGGIVYTFKAL